MCRNRDVDGVELLKEACPNLFWTYQLMDLDLMGLDLMGLDLMGLDLMGLDLMGLDLMGLDLMATGKVPRILARKVGIFDAQRKERTENEERDMQSPENWIHMVSTTSSIRGI
jgi:hypothetical protein